LDEDIDEQSIRKLLRRVAGEVAFEQVAAGRFREDRLAILARREQIKLRRGALALRVAAPGQDLNFPDHRALPWPRSADGGLVQSSRWCHSVAVPRGIRRAEPEDDLARP